MPQQSWCFCTSFSDGGFEFITEYSVENSKGYLGYKTNLNLYKAVAVSDEELGDDKLQSLDVDNDPSNGITITNEVLAILANNGVVTLPRSDDELEALIRQLQDAGINFGGDYVSEYEAYEHLEETRRELEYDDDYDDDHDDDHDSNYTS